MEHYSYVDAVNSNLVCCICRNPFVEPTTSSTCGHTFCRACIDQALEISPCCPIDRSQLRSTDLHLASAVVRNMVDELLVECPHAPLGCTHTAQRHLISAHAAVCPWFRPANAPPPVEPEPPRFEFRPLVGRRRVSSPLHTSMFHFDDPGTQNASLTGRRRAGSGSRLVISTTNPPEDSAHEISTLDPFAHPLPSPTDSHQQRLEAVPYVPPLPTHTSLEHTLSTLRNSLVSMAASLDMSERRQEVVVTTESLRMHEEVGAIRAIVHGLRMQVSALVMERNVQMMGRLSGRINSSNGRNGERGDDERWATETRYYNQPPPQPVNLAVPYSVRRQETNNKL
ncbi:hypothetical protein FRC06_001356 [Ceratobasidium sp. 370]|nr:hypothetical protein FRC06_001356 [Ceratobasidium sp. 370]